MAYNANVPADDGFVADAPEEIRTNAEALRTDQIVDAGKVKGLSTGNASGNIPINNGVINANLNAQYLGGNLASAFAPATHPHSAVTTSANGFMINTDKAKLDGIAAGAQVNQNAFANVLVGSTTIQADTATDTLTFVAGDGITLTPNASADTVTIAVTPDGHPHAVATTGAAGFMSAADKTKVDGIAAGAEVNQNAFTTIVAGGVSAVADQKTDTFTINAGAGVTIVGDAANDACTISVPASGHVHSDATTSAAGFMTAAMVTKLNGIAAGAQTNQNAFASVLVGSTTVAADSATDTLELVAGTNIALTPDAANDRVTIGVTGTVAAATTAGACTGNAATATTCTGNAATATTLQIARLFGISGDVIGTATSFNGGANITIPATLAASGVASGTYTSVTVDAKGRVTGGSNPTTISANTTGNAATATALQTARNINGVPFNGGADITIPVGGFGVQGSFKNLKITNGATADSQVVVTADQVVLFNASNLAFLAVNPSVTINTGTTGANGRDAGSLAASAWYSVWLIYNGTTVAGLLSASATTPTMPSGYTFKARVGYVKTDSSGNLLRTLQVGCDARYIVTNGTNTAALPIIASGSQGNVLTPTWVSASVSAFVPPSAKTINVHIYCHPSGVLSVAPNNNYGGGGSPTNPPPIAIAATPSGVGFSSCMDILLESTNLYYAADHANARLFCQGWEDNI